MSYTPYADASEEAADVIRQVAADHRRGASSSVRANLNRRAVADELEWAASLLEQDRGIGVTAPFMIPNPCRTAPAGRVIERDELAEMVSQTLAEGARAADKIVAEVVTGDKLGDHVDPMEAPRRRLQEERAGG